MSGFKRNKHANNKKHDQRDSAPQLNPAMNGQHGGRAENEGFGAAEGTWVYQQASPQHSVATTFVDRDDDFVEIVRANQASEDSSSTKTAMAPSIVPLIVVAEQHCPISPEDPHAFLEGYHHGMYHQHLLSTSSWTSSGWHEMPRVHSSDSMMAQNGDSYHSAMACSHDNVIVERMTNLELSHASGSHLDLPGSHSHVHHPLLLTASGSQLHHRRSHSRLMHNLSDSGQLPSVGESSSEPDFYDEDHEHDHMEMRKGRQH